MTVHLLPCGTSLLRVPRPDEPPVTLNRREVAEAIGWAARELGAEGLNAPARWAASFAADLGHLFGPLRSCQDPVRLCAETASLHRHEPRPSSSDPVVLLASDTPEGVVDAMLVGVALGRPVHFHPSPLLDGTVDGVPIIEDMPGQPVHVIRIEGLLPDSTDRFTEATRGLAHAMTWAARLPRLPAVPFVLHLTGGYKATLPYLVSLAEYVGAAWPPVRAWCLHEGDGRKDSANKPVRIWLRRVNLVADLAVLEDVAATGVLPDDTRLLDFAYRDVDGHAEPTPLGEGLRAVAVYLRAGP